MKKSICFLILSLVVLGALAIANREIKNKITPFPEPKKIALDAATYFR